MSPADPAEENTEYSAHLKAACGSLSSAASVNNQPSRGGASSAGGNNQRQIVPPMPSAQIVWIGHEPGCEASSPNASRHIPTLVCTATEPSGSAPGGSLRPNRYPFSSVQVTRRDANAQKVLT